jgi:molybdopterin-containing oxidoreductase family iron-sulfur binding subunit
MACPDNCLCNKDNSNRRAFFKSSLASLTATLVGGSLINSFVSCRETDEKNREKVKVLTSDGKLMEVDSAHLQHGHEMPVTNEAARKGIPGKKFVMVIDLAKCDGCGECTKACQKMHFTPPDREWIKVYTMQDSEQTAPYYFPKPCFHCDNPPCTKVCPVDATFKRQDGIVLIDNTRCIGCRFCMAACPYSVRFFNWDLPQETAEEKRIPYSPEQSFPRIVGTVEKCDFCPHVMRNGKMPACVVGCPMGAIYMGDENEDAVTNSAGVTMQLSKMLADNSAYRYMEELGTKPRVYYLPPKNRRYPVPEIDEKKGKNSRHDSMKM